MGMPKGLCYHSYRFIIDSVNDWFELWRCLPKNLPGYVRDCVNRYIEYLMLAGSFDKADFFDKNCILYEDLNYPNSKKLFEGSISDLYTSFLTKEFI